MNTTDKVRVFFPTGEGLKGIEQDSVKVMYSVFESLNIKVTRKEFAQVAHKDKHGFYEYVWGMVLSGHIEDSNNVNTILKDLGYIVVAPLNDYWRTGIKYTDYELD